MTEYSYDIDAYTGKILDKDIDNDDDDWYSCQKRHRGDPVPFITVVGEDRQSGCKSGVNSAVGGLELSK